MPELVSWYQAEGWRGTGIVQLQSWDQASANNWFRSNASTEPVHISVLAWYRCPVPRHYRWTTFSQVTLWSRASGRPCLCQQHASIAPVLQILLRYWLGTKPVVNFHLGDRLPIWYRCWNDNSSMHLAVNSGPNYGRQHLFLAQQRTKLCRTLAFTLPEWFAVVKVIHGAVMCPQWAGLWLFYFRNWMP